MMECPKGIDNLYGVNIVVQQSVSDNFVFLNNKLCKWESFLNKLCNNSIRIRVLKLSANRMAEISRYLATETERKFDEQYR